MGEPEVPKECRVIPAGYTTLQGSVYQFTDNAPQPAGSGSPTVIGASEYARGYAGQDGFNDVAGRAAGQGIRNSIALVFSKIAHTNKFNSVADPANSVGLYFDGEAAFGSQIATGQSISSAVNVSLTYDGTTLSITIGSFTHSWTVDIPSEVQGTTAYVGFTASAAGGVQSLNSWTM